VTATVHIDGASRGNPGPAAYAFSMVLADGEIIEQAEPMGKTTNNVAEYTALVEALHRAAAAGVTHLDVYSDSELLVKQMRGEYKVKNADLKVLVDEAKQLMISFGDVRFEHVRREQNKRADELCNLALDGKPIKKSVESDLASPSAELTNAAMKVLIRHVDLDIAEAIWRDLWKTIRPKS